MIKAILFDYGGVITHGGTPGMLSNNLATKLNIPNDRAAALLEYGFDKIKRGLITEDEFWHILEKAYGAPIPLESRDIWMKKEDVIPISEVVALCQSLRRHGVKTGILSNVEPVVVGRIREIGGYTDFAPLILSCEAGYAKPDIEIYEIALRKLDGLSPEETLFIDDQERLLAPARQLGMQTLHAVGPEQLIADIRHLLGLDAK